MNDKEIQEQIKFYVKTEYDFDELEFYIEKKKDGSLLVEVYTTYRSPTYERIDLMAKALGYDFGEKYDDISSSGCETCDYGSRYGFALRFWNSK